MNLEGRTALVTGASRNIGRAIAVQLAEGGADVGVTARTDEDGCRETARRVEAAGGEAAVALGDLADPDAVASTVEEIRAELGPIDTLVNNATYRPEKPFLDVSLEELDRVANVNFRGLFLTTQHVVPDMIEHGGGAVVNQLGVGVYQGGYGRAHSFGSKMAIDGMVRQLATELGRDGIRVNGLSPGIIDVGRDADEEWERREREIADSTPLGRLGEIEEVADACTFLVSDRASFITGQVLHVNGGLHPTPIVAQPE
jgi:3-oxoacyl-[acyl-carrier protein] reductase